MLGECGLGTPVWTLMAIANPLDSEITWQSIPVGGWLEAYPWLVHGTTARGMSARAADFRLFGVNPVEEVLARWESLRSRTGMDRIVHARQVHGTSIRMHRGGGAGLLVTPPADGHLTRDPGVLLTVATADCVPVFVVAPEERVVGLLHAGWRGAAAGILEEGIEAFRIRFGIEADRLRFHLGPSIGADSYEVGSEVFRALGLPDPGAPAMLDLRGALAERAGRAGVEPAHITISERDTLEDPRLFSHRGGDEGRQVSFLGIRDR